jgi:hypothetical protein
MSGRGLVLRWNDVNEVILVISGYPVDSPPRAFLDLPGSP